MAQLGAQCVKVHVCMQAHLPMSDQRMVLGYLPFSVSPVFLPFFFSSFSEAGLSLSLELTFLPRLAGERATRVHPSPSLVYLGSEDPNSGSQALCLLSHLPGPSSQVSLRQEPPAIPNHCWDSSCSKYFILL